MRKSHVSLIALLVLCFTASVVSAQDTAGAAQKAGETSAEEPRNEVEKKIEELRNKGDKVFGTCIQDCEGKAADQDMEAGRALLLPKPAFPSIARAAHASGKVRVQILIGLDGTVIAAAAIGGHPLLQAASVAAAREALFSVTKMSGSPVLVTGVLEYNFVAQ